MSLVSKTVNGFLDELASPSVAPGGGSIAALAGALGAALTSMVCQVTIGKKKYADVEAEMKAVLDTSEKFREQITRLVDRDTDAFNQLMAAMAMPKTTDEEKDIRAAAIQTTTQTATLVPLELMKLCVEAIALTETAALKGNANATSDAGVAALMLEAACRGAYYNVLTNLSGMKDGHFVMDTRLRAHELVKRIQIHSEAIVGIVEPKLGL